MNLIYDVTKHLTFTELSPCIRHPAKCLPMSSSFPNHERLHAAWQDRVNPEIELTESQPGECQECQVSREAGGKWLSFRRLLGGLLFNVLSLSETIPSAGCSRLGRAGSAACTLHPQATVDVGFQVELLCHSEG